MDRTPAHADPLSHSLLRPHVCLRDTDFVHKLSKSNSVVTGELAQDIGWASEKKRKTAESQQPHRGPCAGSGDRKSAYKIRPLVNAVC